MRRLIVPILLLIACGDARADHFGWRKDAVDGAERGIVTSHGMELFEIATPAGGYSPSQRAQVIADRLNDLEASHDLAPQMFGVSVHKGMIVLQQQEHTDHPPHIICTVDSAMARQHMSGDAERLANWMLALLRDHVSLATGRMPFHTSGTPVGEVFRKLYARLNPTGNVSPEEIERAIADLRPSERDLFRRAASRVPESFREDRIFVVEAPNPRSRESADHSDTAVANHDHHEHETAETHAAHDEAEPFQKRSDGERNGERPNKPEHDTSKERPEDDGAPAPHDEHAESGKEKPAAPAKEKDRAQPGKTESRPSGDAHAETRRSATVRKSGDYTVELLTDPAILKEGVAAAAVRISVARPESRPSEDVDVRAWLTRRGERQGPSAPGVYDVHKDAYTFDLLVDDPGNYRLVVIIVAGQDDPVRVEFPITVETGHADKPERVAKPDRNP